MKKNILQDNERVRMVKDHYCKTNIEFGNKIGVSGQRVGNMLNTGYSIGSKAIKQIIAAFPNINPNWLFDGTGEMFLDIEKEHITTSSTIQQIEINENMITKAGIEYIKTPSGKYVMKVPLVPSYAYAKYIDDCRDAIEWEGDEFAYFPADQIYHGSYMAFEIKGDSMDDDSKRSLSHGDVVNARELSKDKWHYKLHTEQYPNWIIVLDNTILCKQIINHDLETGEITCHSLNTSPEYTDFSVNLNDVCKLFNVVQKTSSSF